MVHHRTCQWVSILSYLIWSSLWNFSIGQEFDRKMQKTKVSLRKVDTLLQQLHFIISVSSVDNDWHFRGGSIFSRRGPSRILNHKPWKCTHSLWYTYIEISPKKNYQNICNVNKSNAHVKFKLCPRNKCHTIWYHSHLLQPKWHDQQMYRELFNHIIIWLRQRLALRHPIL